MTVLVDVGAAPLPVATMPVIVVPGQNPAPPPGRGEEFGKASPVALVVIVLLALATILLIRSMSHRIKRLPPSFGPPDGDEGTASTPGRDASEPGDGVPPRS